MTYLAGRIHPTHWFSASSKWVRSGIVLAVLLASVFFPLQGAPELMIAVAGAPLALGGAWILLRWPPLGLLLLIGAMVIPLRGPSGLAPTMGVLALLLGLWVLHILGHRQKIALVKSITLRPILFFILVATLALGMGQLDWFSFAQSAPLGAQLGGWAIFVLSAAAFLLVANQVRDVRWLQAMVWSFLVVGAVHVFLRVAQLFSLAQLFFPRGSTDSLFWTWLVALSFSQAVFNRDLRPGWRILLGVLTAAALYVGYFQASHWKSGWIPPLIVVFSIIGIFYWRVVLPLIPIVLIPVSSVITYLIATDSYSWGTRVDAWLIVVEIAKANPILGLGFGNYRWYTPLFPIRGWAVQFNSHSQYVDIVAQTGLVGLFAFGWLFAAIGWLAWRLRERVPAGFARAYVYGALGGLAGTLAAGALGDWVLPFFYNVGLKGFRSSVLAWLFLGGLVVLENLYPAQGATPATREAHADGGDLSRTAPAL